MGIARTFTKQDPELAAVLSDITAARVHVYAIGSDAERVAQRLDAAWASSVQRRSTRP
jgi:outer membrane murein-binding lipoprotein Lpp